MMRSLNPVTPAEAMSVWSSIESPSARSVAKAMTQAGRRVHHSTISRWRAEGWRPVAHRPHLLEGARQALDLAAGVLTGDPAAGTKFFEDHPAREQLDGLSDSDVLMRSARELCILSILACDEFQLCASKLVSEKPAEVAQLLKALCRAFPAATAVYGEALKLKSREHRRPKDGDGTAYDDPLHDLLRFKATSDE